jgi:Flp pilus assembly protein TadD
MPDNPVVTTFLLIGGAIGTAALVAAFLILAGFIAERRLPPETRKARAAARAALADQSDPLALAFEAVRLGEEEACALRLQERIERLPKGPLRARAILALAYLSGTQGHYSEARQGYTQSLRMAPALAGTCVDLAGMLVRDGRDAAAEDLLTIALPYVRGDSDSREKAPLAHQLLGQIMRRDERYAEAEEQLRQALALRPTDPMLIANYGAILETLDRHEEAARQYREGMRLAPTNAVLHAQMGSLLMRQGEFDQADTHLELSAELFPDRPTTRVQLATLKLKLGQWGAAEREAGAAVAMRPEMATAHANLGRALLQQGKLNEAEGHSRRAVELAPGNGSAHALLGYVLLSKGLFVEAQGRFRQSLKLEPDLPRKLREEAALLDGMGLAASAHAERTHADWLEQAYSGEGMASR